MIERRHIAQWRQNLWGLQRHGRSFPHLSRLVRLDRRRFFLVTYHHTRDTRDLFPLPSSLSMASFPSSLTTVPLLPLEVPNRDYEYPQVTGHCQDFSSGRHLAAPERFTFGVPSTSLVEEGAATPFFGRIPSAARQRTSHACEKCRERKTKCSGERPVCQRCAARALICEYSTLKEVRRTRCSRMRHGTNVTVMDFNSTEDEQRSGEREAKTTTMSIKPTYVDVSETLHAGQHHGAQAQFSQYCPALSSSTSASTTGGTWQFTEPETPVTSSGGRLMPSTSDVQATPRALDEGFLTSYVSMFDQYIQCPILDSNINPALWCSVRNDDYDFVSEAMSSTSSSESLLNAFDDLPETLWPTSMRSQSLNSSSCSSGSSASAVMSPSPTLTNQSTSLDRRLTPLGSPSSESIGQLELFSDNGVDEARFLSDEGNLMREYYARLQHNEDMGLQSLNAIKLE